MSGPVNVINRLTLVAMLFLKHFYDRNVRISRDLIDVISHREYLGTSDAAMIGTP